MLLFLDDAKMQLVQPCATVPCLRDTLTYNKPSSEATNGFTLTGQRKPVESQNIDLIEQRIELRVTHGGLPEQLFPGFVHYKPSWCGHCKRCLRECSIHQHLGKRPGSVIPLSDI